MQWKVNQTKQKAESRPIICVLTCRFRFGGATSGLFSLDYLAREELAIA